MKKAIEDILAIQQIKELSDLDRTVLTFIYGKSLISEEKLIFGYKELAKKIGHGHRSIARSYKVLKEEGYLIRKRVYRGVENMVNIDKIRGEN